MGQVTFTTDDVKEAAKWLNFVHERSRWGSNITTKEAQEIGQFCNWCHKHIKMMQDHIMELVAHTPAKDDSEQKTPVKKAK